MPRNAAFTLIELTVSIAIVGILSALLLAQFSQLQESSLRSKLVVFIRNSNTAATAIALDMPDPVNPTTQRIDYIAGYTANDGQYEDATNYTISHQSYFDLMPDWSKGSEEGYFQVYITKYFTSGSGGGPRLANSIQTTICHPDLPLDSAIYYYTCANFSANASFPAYNACHGNDTWYGVDFNQWGSCEDLGS